MPPSQKSTRRNAENWRWKERASRGGTRKSYRARVQCSRRRGCGRPTACTRRRGPAPSGVPALGQHPRIEDEKETLSISTNEISYVLCVFSLRGEA